MSLYNPNTEKVNIAEIIVAKNRNGQTGTSEVLWLGGYTKFTNKPNTDRKEWAT